MTSRAGTTRPIRTGAAALLVVLVLGGVAVWRLPAWRSSSTLRPSILLITLDTTRADHLGAYGDANAQTPSLDRLASNGVLFERVVSAAPITLPAHVSLLTGRYPFAHGVRNNGNFRVSDDVPTLATTLHDRGYRTAAFVSAFVLDRRAGLSRGFDVYDDHLDTAGGRASEVEVERRGDRTGLAARNWLANHLHGSESGTPFLVWVHLYDPHDPYTPPPPFDDRFRDHPYDGEIAFDDAVVGSLVGQLADSNAVSSTIVAVVADHGESLGEHGEVTHAMFVYESALRVPMIVGWPGHLAPARVGALVRGIDLAPTLLDLAGMPPLPDAQGQSLRPLARGGKSGGMGAPSSAYGETYFPLFFMNWTPLRSIQDDRWKLIDAPAPELYDLVNDPHEHFNVAAREPARTAALRRALDSLSGTNAGTMKPVKPDREAIEKLAALGYVGEAVDPALPSSAGTRPDPKAMIDTFNRLREANSAVSGRRPAEAEAIARDVLGQDHQNAFARLILARAQMQQNRHREAIASFRQYAALVPTSADAHYWIAVCALRLDEPEKALAEASAALALDPLYVGARLLRAGLLTERGRLDEAAPDYQRAVELQPSNADAHSGYGVLLAARRDPEGAVAEFKRALQIRPDLHDVRLALGGLLEDAGRPEEARAEYERVSLSTAASTEARSTARSRLARMTTRMSR
jgi:arylsulfatase A-like enzyme/Tfp pilus assembly protein PilF